VRKLFIAAIAAALAVAGFAVFAFAGTGEQSTSWEFTFSKKGENVATGSNSILVPAKKDDKGTSDTSDDHYNAPSKNVIEFTKGSAVNTGARARCKETPSDVQSGREKCPAKTKVGAGIATSLLGQPDDGAGTEVVAPIEAFNQKKGLLFIVRPCSPGTGPGKGSPCTPIPGGTIAIVGTWSKASTKPTLTVPTPPALLTGGVIITRFQLKTNRFKSDKGNFVTTPEVCQGGTWSTRAISSYQDGSKQVIKDTMPCNS
jgi:hypothetical protein